MDAEAWMTADRWQVYYDELKERAKNPDAEFTFDEFRSVTFTFLIDRAR